MTEQEAKQLAQEMVDKFIDDVDLWYHEAKKCALICIDHSITTVMTIDAYNTGELNSVVENLEQVKEQIEKL